MLPIEGKVFSSADFVFELKWDGYRAVAWRDEGVRVMSRNAKDLTWLCPEVKETIRSLPGGDLILDGELVILDQDGKADFSALQSVAKSRERRAPITLVLFDVLYHRGKNVCSLPLVDRKDILEAIVKSNTDHLLVSRSIEQAGEALYSQTKELGIEGIVAKKKNSQYCPGSRSKDWIKIKHTSNIDCVIGGYLPNEQGFRSLYLGIYSQGHLFYIGSVGTGFSGKEKDILYEGMKRIIQPQCPFANVAFDTDDGVWIEPVLVASVDYLEFTRERRLRHPIFRGLRSDKRPEDCQSSR